MRSDVTDHAAHTHLAVSHQHGKFARLIDFIVGPLLDHHQVVLGDGLLIGAAASVRHLWGHEFEIGLAHNFSFGLAKECLIGLVQQDIAQRFILDENQVRAGVYKGTVPGFTLGQALIRRDSRQCQKTLMEERFDQKRVNVRRLAGAKDVHVAPVVSLFSNADGINVLNT